MRTYSTLAIKGFKYTNRLCFARYVEKHTDRLSCDGVWFLTLFEGRFQRNRDVFSFVPFAIDAQVAPGTRQVEWKCEVKLAFVEGEERSSCSVVPSPTMGSFSCHYGTLCLSSWNSFRAYDPLSARRSVASKRSRFLFGFVLRRESEVPSFEQFHFSRGIWKLFSASRSSSGFLGIEGNRGENGRSRMQRAKRAVFVAAFPRVHLAAWSHVYLLKKRYRRGSSGENCVIFSMAYRYVHRKRRYSFSIFGSYIFIGGKRRAETMHFSRGENKRNSRVHGITTFSRVEGSFW